jgi:biotin carboxyl carrier protein
MNWGAGSIASLNDARALLDTLVSQGWQSAVVRVGESEFLLSRDALLERGLPAEDAAEAPGAGPAAAPAQLQTISAPHVGTLAEIAAVGSMVTKGEMVAVLAVLGERFEISASASGQVLGHKAELGALVEYGQVLAELTS